VSFELEWLISPIHSLIPITLAITSKIKKNIGAKDQFSL